ncbi:hypothetical protein J3R30DRAFT_3511370 [Lentinula aciculospora]|uniref:RhoGAP-domain-containing protein n=1 Tax=Lentinula aciculospora TaxID=153920 RepID=A0A9W9A3N1_9AGAR|nr:hypothetical protein J3R30DRAFT_3511370 [Lentinula aciculospora]
MSTRSSSLEKDNRQTFPHSSSPHRQTTLPTASSSATNLPTSINPTPHTVESILALHASAPDPKLAALDQAVSERNVLSSQNSQLWKLIEKQRSGYNQILKELERVRNERDTYKARLAVSTGGSLEKGHPTRERTQKQSVDSVTPDGGVSSNSGDHPPRHNMTKFYSNEQVVPRTNTQSLHPARSQEPLTNSSAASVSSSSLVSSTTSTNASFNNSQPTARLAPLTVPPRSDTLPELSATQETPPQSFNNATPKYSHFAHGYNDSIISSISYSSTSNSHSPSTKPSTKPSVYPRKSSFTESVSSASTSSSVDGASGSAYSGIATGGRYDYTSQNTPQTAPAEYSSNPLYTPVAPHGHEITGAPHIITSFPSPTTLDRGQHTSPMSQKTSNNLTALSPAIRNPLSRESRISLPDEAKQYIANMGESPAPSPRAEMFKPSSSLSQSFVPVSAGRAKDQEFLDIEEEVDDDDDDEEGDEGGDEPDDDYEVVDPSSASAQTFTPSASAGSSQDQLPGQLGSSSTSFPGPFTQAPPARSSSNRQYVAESNDFSLPPSTMPPHHAEARAEAAYQRQLIGNTSAQRSNDDLRSQRLDTQNISPPTQSNASPSPAGFFRALPLLPTDLPHTKINVSHSFVRPNDRGKEVLSFIVYVHPGKGKEGWKVEKMYSEVLNLDQRVRSSVGKSVGKKIATLPEGKLWKDHAPAKADQRKAVLETYLQTLINLPVKNNDEVIAFFTTDVVKDTMQPVMQAGHKEGYLTKRGKNFGGWKTRYFVLQGPVLEYFDARGGTHLGSITVTGAQIGRQQRNNTTPSTDEEKEYRHAFLIVEAKKGPGGNHPRHVLCAESDAERDSWVEILVRYFTGTYSEEPVAYAPAPIAPPPPPPYVNTTPQPPSGVPRTSLSADPRKPSRSFSKDDIGVEKRAIPLSQLPQDATNAKLFSRPSQDDYSHSSSPSKSIAAPVVDPRNPEWPQQGQPSSLPDSSPLSNPPPSLDPGQRANSEMGHYPDVQTVRAQQQRQSPELYRHRGESSKQSQVSPGGPLLTDRVPSPEKMDKVKISAPMNGAPIPAGYKFGKDTPSEASLTPSASDRREKAKSRSFWGFGRPGGGGDKNPVPSAAFMPRAVFAVNLEESLDVAQFANLPAIVFRCIQYLESKKADQEEGIYRLSGSSAVIKSLKERFNAEGDVDLLASDEYWDPHAIAGLLKSFLRELPSSILTRELHMRFLSVIDFVDPQERIRELSQLIASLPIANYSLLRALTAHLILIVQNSAVNKMTMRNVGIVFSPTLSIPAGVFSLMLGEFNRVFNVDAGQVPPESNENTESEPDRRNSMQYSEAAADKLLGLSGRSLTTPAEENQSDTDEYSIEEDSGTEPEMTVESSADSPVGGSQQGLSPPDTPLANNSNGRASNLAAGRGLNISVSDRGHRYSRMMGLPSSPRPPPSPGGHSASPSPSPAQ